MNILVTGGAGYIGSHTCLELLNEGHKVIVIDNLCNSSINSIERIESLTSTSIPFYKINVGDKIELIKVFEMHNIHGVIHFAGLKAVNESVENPFKYYENNVQSSFVLVEVMKKFDCKTIVFSSSATVYGKPHKLPIKEDCPLNPTTPYGNSKIVVENFLKDIFASDNNWKIAILRYFNPVGAHKSGMIGEDPSGVPNNLMPYISQVAIGKRKKLSVFGGDYKTKDGTGIRDYIHVVDIAKGHIKSLEAINNNSQIFTLNLGTGKGYSVLEIVNKFESVAGQKINYDIIDRRPGDIAECYANPILAEKLIGWKSRYKLSEMCEDTWRWQMMNPNGYAND